MYLMNCMHTVVKFQCLRVLLYISCFTTVQLCSTCNLYNMHIYYVYIITINVLLQYSTVV